MIGAMHAKTRYFPSKAILYIRSSGQITEGELKDACGEVIRRTMQFDVHLLAWDFLHIEGGFSNELLISLPFLLYIRGLRYRTRLAIISGTGSSLLQDDIWPWSTQCDRGVFIRVSTALREGITWLSEQG